MMTTEKKPLKIVFAPGCFDTFEGTQEELDEFVAEINDLVQSGEIFEKSTPVDFDSLSDDDMDALEKIINAIQNDSDTPTRNLH